jgi:hypothetical protein
MGQGEVPKEELLRRYFQAELPDLGVYVEWKIDAHSFRFYFADEHENRYVLDVDRGVLKEQNVAELIRDIETERWKEVLQERSGQINRYSDKGFSR